MLEEKAGFGEAKELAVSEETEENSVPGKEEEEDPISSEENSWIEEEESESCPPEEDENVSAFISLSATKGSKAIPSSSA